MNVVFKILSTIWVKIQISPPKYLPVTTEVVKLETVLRLGARTLKPFQTLKQ